MTAAWLYEHSPEFAVPESIIRLEGIEDMSWHNDTCPSFGVRITDSLDLRIWCEHPDPESRESGADHQFTINASGWDDDAWEVLRAAGLEHITGEFPAPPGAPITDFGTDDPQAAVALFLLALAHIQAARRSVCTP